MRIKKSHLKELIRQAIDELKEGGPGSGRPKERGSDDDYAPDGGHFNAAQAVDDLDGPEDDVGGPAHPNVPKKKKKVKESKQRRYTVKEVKTWMKTLEENRYKKTYNSDARRVAWMVNNEGVELSEMPVSMAKKWSKAAYGRERHLAKEFLKSKKEQMAENKIRKIVREILTEHTVKFSKAEMAKLHKDGKIEKADGDGKMHTYTFKEGKNKGLWHNIHAKRKRGEKPAKKGDKNYPKTLDIEEKAIHHMDMRMLYVPKKDIKNVVKLLRLNIKKGQVEVEKKPSDKVKGFYRLTTSKKMFDDVVTHLATKNIGVKTIAKGKM